MPSVNVLAVILSAVLSMVVGSLWYGPLFGKKWMKLISMTKEEMEKGKKDMPKTYGMMFVGSLVTSYVLAITIGMAATKDITTGVLIAFFMWLGFIVPAKLSEVLFEKKAWALFYIESGYYFVFLLIAGGVIGVLA